VYRQIVFAAAWQESCWRQFVKKGNNLPPLASATGDLGLMQDNGNSGSEILLYYLARHAIRKASRASGSFAFDTVWGPDYAPLQCQHGHFPDDPCTARLARRQDCSARCSQRSSRSLSENWL
jgi:hypothetical protein